MVSDLDGGGIPVSRRTVLRAAAGGFGLFVLHRAGGVAYAVEVAGSPRILDPRRIPKFASSLTIPPVMPQAAAGRTWNGNLVDYYEISMRQFEQQMLPPGLPSTTVWGYGPAGDYEGPSLHRSPGPTLEAAVDRPVRVKWSNELVGGDGQFLPHLLPVDPTLHWANPPGGRMGRDSHTHYTSTPKRYRGPVPMVVHVHGMGDVGDESDGYPEAWFLPDANNIPAGYARVGTWFSFFAQKAARKLGVSWGRGFVEVQYPNEQEASTAWFHDHTLGMTRVNVYAGPLGFYLLRGGAKGIEGVMDTRTGAPAMLPGPAPRAGDPIEGGGPYYEIPLAIQDRSFKPDGSLFYPDSRTYFDGITGPYVPDSDVPPIWNPEFFGNTIMVNGTTWPALTVEQRRYRFRLLNSCNSRFLILDFSRVPGAQVWQIASEGGFLEAPVNIGRDHRSALLLGPAERVEVIVDFTDVPVGRHVLANIGPDEPYGGGVPGKDFPPADPKTTGRVLAFDVVAATSADLSTPPEFLGLPRFEVPKGGHVRRLAAIEEMSTEFEDAPIAGLLGTVTDDHWKSYRWMDPVTENPRLDATEVWEFYNTTADAHPLHIHVAYFRVVNRQPIELLEGERRVVLRGKPRGPEPGELGLKDTVIAYPGEVTRVRMTFDTPGQYVWHCHILEHEDNDMMRPMRVGPMQDGQPM